MKVSIIQGNDGPPHRADVNIVIDVLRAFTVAHFAFLHDAQKIIMVNTTEQAFRWKQQLPDCLLAGEIKGYPIPGFDLDNSPQSIQQQSVKDKILVHKTTNGVKAALNSLNADTVLVTGFSNAENTALYAKQLQPQSVQIIASHPTSDDDLACAEYIRSILCADNEITPDQVVERIKNSLSAEKFYSDQPEFDPSDVDVCSTKAVCDFVMHVVSDGTTVTVEKTLF